MNAIDSSNLAPMVVLCAVSIFVILFAIILRTLRQMPFFDGSNPVPIAVCVTLLCILGLHQLFVQPAGTETAPADDARRSLDFLLLPYTAMALAMLLALCLLLLDKVEASGDVRYIPLLEAWQKIDYKKVAQRIEQVVE